MEDLDFTQPARSKLYDPAVARACFEAGGNVENVAQGQAFFSEGDASEKMYLLLEGELRLLRSTRTLDIIRADEIFGEGGVISGQPRSASAVAKIACRAISMKAAAFQQAIQSKPEFALMLLSIMIDRVRLSDAILARTGRLANATEEIEHRIFDRKLLEDLSSALHGRVPQQFSAKRAIMREGESGGFMYVVLDGRIAVSIKGKVVQHIGSGGVVGEMALVDQSPRAATATAETDCSLLAINRNDFLTLVRSKPAFATSLLKAVTERLRQMTALQG